MTQITKKKRKNSFLICPPLPIIIMTIYFYYYNIFWDFFSVPPFTFYTQEKNIVHKKEFEIPREKKSFILKESKPENEICVERNTTTYTHTYYTLKTDVIAYNNVEKNPISLSEKKNMAKNQLFQKNCVVWSFLISS